MDARRLSAYRQKLRDKQADLTAEIARIEQDRHQFENIEVEDYGDRAENTYTKESLFQQIDLSRGQLSLVEDALRRLAAGDFGRCVDCGGEIESKRLEAVPWASHCMQCEQRKQSRLV
jgi:RNA polymerase-binding protein DksA